MSIIRTFLRDFGYLHRDDLRKSARGYSAASSSRLLGDWIMSPVTADADIRAGLLAVRTRARDLAQNNDLAKAYLRAMKKNVVGSSGFALQVKAMDYFNGKLAPDKADNDYLERSFYEWMKPETATVTGKLSFRKVQELVIETVARDGEIFIHLMRGERINQFGFTLQIIEPDYVDEKYSDIMKNGNIIVMGVEMTLYRKPVAYHVAEQNTSLALYGSFYVGAPYRRIPAGDIIHIYDPDRADQTRGISWMHSGMVSTRHLGGYIEAAVVNSRAGACKMGFFTDPTGDAGEYQGDETKADTGLQTDIAEPGTFKDIGRHGFTPYDPKYPHEQFDPFTKAMIRFIASGLGVSYQTLSGDLSETSYASGRQGLLEERETYKSAQEFIRETFLDRVYAEWLYMGLMTGRLNLPFAKFKKFNSPKWTGRRWSWVDPLKDVQAAKEARAAGFKSSTQIINEAGGDIEDTYLEMEQENALASEHGLKLDYGVKPETVQTNKADMDNEDQMAGKPKNKGNGKATAAND